MSNFDKSYELLKRLEFSSATSALHQNKGENGLTFMGIYEKAHPNWDGWDYIYDILGEFDDICKASNECYQFQPLQVLAQNFYEKEFWQKLRLDEIKSEKITRHMFVFAVNAGCARAVKLAQKALNLANDGVMNTETIKALNLVNEAEFCKKYIEQMTKFYENLAQNNPSKKIFLKGWFNRIQITDNG